MAKNIAIVKRVSTDFIERRKNERRNNNYNFALPASLLTQMMVDYKSLNIEPKPLRTPVNEPINAYSAGAKITQKRVPAGWQQAFNA